MRRNGLILAVALAGTLALATLTGCSREKIDWKSAEAADTVEAYDRFLGLHPEGALAVQARARVAQLNEDRDWKKAAAADTVDAYKQFSPSTRAASGRKRRAFASRIFRSMGARQGP